MSEPSQQKMSLKFSKEQLISIFKSSSSDNPSIESLSELMPEIFSKTAIEPESLLPPSDLDINDALVETAEITPRPMRLVTQKRTTIPKSPFLNSGYAETPTSRVWYYIDEGDAIQGPFTSLEMDFWFDSGFFFNELLIRIKENNDFVKLIQLFGKTEIIQVYRPVPFGMISQCMSPADLSLRSAELKGEALSSKSVKKQTIYNFGFEPEINSPACFNPLKTVDGLQTAKNVSLNAERRETADSSISQSSPKGQDQRETATNELETLNLGSPIVPEKQKALSLTEKEKTEESPVAVNEDKGKEMEGMTVNQLNEVLPVTKSGRSSEENKKWKQETIKEEHYNEKSDEKRTNEKKSQAKKCQKRSSDDEKTTEYYEKGTRKEQNGKQYREKGQYQFVPKNKESTQAIGI